MKEKEIKLLVNEAHVLQERLLDIEHYIWDNIKSEVKAKSSFGEYASLLRIVFTQISLMLKFMIPVMIYMKPKLSNLPTNNYLN